MNFSYAHKKIMSNVPSPQFFSCSEAGEKKSSGSMPARIAKFLFGKKEVVSPFNILIAGGGTGGHLFPGIAIAEALMERDQNNRLLFVNTGNKFERSALQMKGFDLETITAEGIKGRGLWMKLKSASKLPKGIFESLRILKKFKPDLVIGMGGYSSGPLVLAAWLMGIKIALHEQNLKPGITNRILFYLADRIYVSFFATSKRLNTAKAMMTGNPIRRAILDASVASEKMDEQAVWTDRKTFTVLVLGGSQGAHSINMAVIDTLKHLNPESNYHFIHQTGIADETMVTDSYMRCGISATVRAFFHDMADLYRKADLIICRAGATTVAEVTSIGKGVIFIPYPFAADNHQVMNARELADKAAAEMIQEKDLSGELLARRIETLASHPEQLKNMMEKSKLFGRPKAAEEIIDDCYNLLTGT
ncbi:MAG: undecaprenyldiphospho-muramoylpentapeptide beta-N-acetylglucosaminyltransferase [Desulfobacterales bacterium]